MAPNHVYVCMGFNFFGGHSAKDGVIRMSIFVSKMSYFWWLWVGRVSCISLNSYGFQVFAFFGGGRFIKPCAKY